MPPRGVLYSRAREDEVNFVGESSSRRQQKQRRRWFIGSCAIGAIILCLLIVLVFAALLLVAFSQVDTNETDEHFNCIPEGGSKVTEQLCQRRGCIWRGSSTPRCYYPSGFGYSVSGGINTTSFGYAALLKRKSDQPSQYGGDIEILRMDAMFETDYRLRVKIYDPNSQRYEVPLATTKLQADNPTYQLSFSTKTFYFHVSRASTRTELFSTGDGFIFADQFLQLSAQIPSNNIYGLGEHITDLKLDTNHSVLTLFARDTAPDPTTPGKNLYGVHPFYVCLETDGNAHGVFLLNSNAMEVELQPSPSISYRTIGGILDFYFFLGPSPEAVVQQYTELIGRPFLPPYWALGFHLCRWGYYSANKTSEVVKRMREKGIPQDTQWNDIDYMHIHLDFTYNHTTFAELPQLVADLHNHGQKYVVITDPGISSTQPPGSYPPFDNGLSKRIFITNSSGDPIIGQVWPGLTAFPDFTNPAAEGYWQDQIEHFHGNVGFDGLWIDMNEPSNFIPGSVNGCPNSTLNSPPFLPGAIRSLDRGIIQKTLCMTASQNLSVHYNVHSLYGHTEALATMTALVGVLGKRSLVISRSTYPGSGTHCGHWLGDNTSQWKHMANSIPGLLAFSLFGIPLVGADICGFFGNTTEQLCTRWQQLGAFYPFSRNHNTFNAREQDPAVWSEASVNSTRNALLMRYKLLPYLYTLFYLAHTNGTTVARPLFFEFPTDSNTWAIDQQFLWGNALLISPVLTENATTVRAYFPKGRWFDLRSGSEVEGVGGYVMLTAPMDTIPLHVRGGAIMPMQEPATTTNTSRQNPFSLLVALDGDSLASGQLFLDDGETLDSCGAGGGCSLISFQASKGLLQSRVEEGGYSGATTALLKDLSIFGLSSRPSRVLVNNSTAATFSWNQTTNALCAEVNISNLNHPFTVNWN